MSYYLFVSGCWNKRLQGNKCPGCQKEGSGAKYGYAVLYVQLASGEKELLFWKPQLFSMLGLTCDLTTSEDLEEEVVTRLPPIKSYKGRLAYKNVHVSTIRYKVLILTSS